MTSIEIIKTLELSPLLPEGGYFRRNYYKSGVSSAIFYLLENKTGSFSELHSLPNDEIWHFYLGDSVELHLFDKDSLIYEKRILGKKILNGQLVQTTVKAGITMGAKLMDSGAWALLGTTMAPPFEDDDYKQQSKKEILELFPDKRTIIESLTRSI